MANTEETAKKISVTKEKTENSGEMIKIENVVKRYGAHYALDGISFTVGQGEIVGFLGPNGAGKTTTMKIITGFLSSDSGEVKIAGHDILDEPDEAKKLIGYLPELPPLYQDMTVGEYMEFVYELKGCNLPRKPHLQEVASVTKIADVWDRLIANLSKGYKQRVGIASALVGDPKIIILDEPTVGLDPKQIIEIRSLIRKLGRRHTVILSTHILPEVQAVCDRIIIIQNGKIIADEKTEEITTAVNQARRFNVRICGPQREVAEALKTVEGVTYVEQSGSRDGDSYAYIVESEKGKDIRRGIFAVCAENNYPLIGLEGASIGLEDVFIRLTENKSAR